MDTTNRITTQALFELELQIMEYVDEIKVLTKSVKDLDDEYAANPTEDNKMFLFETIDRYKFVVDKMRILLEAYFAEETRAGMAHDFLLRRLYKKLEDAY